MSIDFTNYTKQPFKDDSFAGITNTFFPAGAPISGRELNEVQERLQSQFYNLAKALAGIVFGENSSSVTYLNRFAIVPKIEKIGNYGIRFCESWICFNGKIYPITEKIIGSESIPVVNGPIYIELSDEISVGENGNTELYENGLQGIVIETQSVYSGTPKSCDEYFKENFINDNGDAESIISARKVRNMVVRNSRNSSNSGSNYIYMGSIERTNNQIEFVFGDAVAYLPDIQDKISVHTHKDIELTVSANDFAPAEDGSFQYVKDLGELGVKISVANPIISINPKYLDITTYESMQDNFSRIDKAVVTNNVLTLTCFSQKPIEGVPIIIKVV